MNKIFSSLMLLVMFAIQTSGVVYYGSEIISETTASSKSEVSNTVASEEVISEEQTSEVTPDEEISTVTSEEVVSEEVVSEMVSEETSLEIASSEVTSEKADVSNIEAKIVIDETGAKKLAKSAKLKDEENMSIATDTTRSDMNAGMATVQIQPLSSTTKKTIENKEVYYTLDSNGNLSEGTTKMPKSYKGNLITVYNGQIVESDSAIARTSGGYDLSFYMYPTLEDASASTNGVSMSGGGFDATYISTEKVNDKYYYHIQISGFDGYVAAENMQIVPEQMMKSRSYYQVEDGDWVYYSAIDPLTSTKYERMELGEAPEGAVVGQKYYSSDDENYITDEIATAKSSVRVSYNSYFMNLPFRSESNYTASDFKGYLKAKGYTNSEYYNETSAFTKVQSYENINSLMMFSMANHESAYGTSSYARACYNFFGRGAIDSDPDQACKYYSYPTATDGILAQSLFLENGYFDILDWRYSGTHVGNKASGMNVKYASDPDWGKKISNHAYMMDSYGRKNNYGKYSILRVNGVKHVYTTSGLSTKVKSKSDSESHSFYDLSQMAGTSNTVNVIAKAQTSNAYQIQVPTAVKQSSSSTCSYTPSKKGTYPNYGGRSKVSVNVGYANYSCDYESYAKQLYWISKSGTSLIYGPSVPQLKNYKYTYKNGKLYTRYTLDTNGRVLESIRYDNNGKPKYRYLYYGKPKYGEQGNYVKIRYEMYTSGYLKEAYSYSESGKILRKYYYQPKTSYSTKEKNYKYVYFYRNDGKYIKSMKQYNDKNQVYRIFRYKEKTTISNKSGRITNCFYIKPGSGDVVTRSYTYTNGYVSKIYHYKSNSHYSNLSNRTTTIFFTNKGFVIKKARRYENGRATYDYYYDAGTTYHDNYGKHVRKKVKL